MDADTCKALLDAFSAQRAVNGWIKLTLRDPEFTGILIDPYCVHEDGSITGPDGPRAKME